MINIIPLLVLLTFFIFRNSFTLMKGKRDIKKVERLIYWGRKLFEVAIFFLFPILLLLNVIEKIIYTPLYILGVVFSLIGLSLMIWTRLNRNKDWGFMGDDTGGVLFTGGPYRFTRHPYYMGALFIGVGLYLQLNFYFIVVLVPSIFFINYVIKKEDSFLESRFGLEYLEYKKKVGVFPWFY